MWIVGARHRLNNPKGEFEIKEIIENSNLDIDWEWDKGNCPHCGKQVKKSVNYKLEKVIVLENASGDRCFIGLTEVQDNGHPVTLRLPDDEFCSPKSMKNKIKNKSNYLKGVDNG